MSATINDGGPAFPATVQDDRDCGNRYAAGYGGMSLRDWFAGQALAGLMAAQIHGMNDVPSKGPFARLAFDAADAMLAARSKGGAA